MNPASALAKLLSVFGGRTVFELLLIANVLGAFRLQCGSNCTITELRSREETFLYRYIPDDISTVVYSNLLMSHVDGSILDGLGLHRQRVCIHDSRRVKRISISSLCNLVDLEVARTGLVEIDFKKNDKLTFLRIDHSQLSAVPATVRQLSAVYIVDIINSQIASLDIASFRRLSEVRIIILSRNKIKSITNSRPDECFNVTQMDVSKNLLNSVNLAVWKSLPSVIYINLSGNRITHLSGSLALDKLVWLNLADNRLLSLGICHWELPNLTTLTLKGNIFATRPICLEKLPKLVQLDMSANRLTELAIASYATLPNLHTLELSGNNMTAIVLTGPGFPPRLKFLKIDRNQLTGLNLSVVPVPALEVEVQHNLIARFDLAGTSPNVSRLNMSNNPIDCSWDTPLERLKVKCIRDIEDMNR